MKKKWILQKFAYEPFGAKKVATALNMSLSSVYFELNTGRLVGKKIGKKWKIMRKDLIDWLIMQNPKI